MSTLTTSVHGPYATQTAAVHDAIGVYRASQAERRAGVAEQVNHAVLGSALSAAGVELAAFDHDILARLADWAPEAVQAVVGWVERAHAEGAAR
jgi:hypothetical protein